MTFGEAPEDNDSARVLTPENIQMLREALGQTEQYRENVSAQILQGGAG